VPDRFLRVALTAALVLLALFVAQPYVTSLLFSADTPRAVTARGDLSPIEASTVALFEHAAPSVVYVFAKARQGAVTFDPETREPRQGGG
jgi:2-alkenal reductase